MGVAGSRAFLNCRQHAADGMVNVRDKRRARDGCTNSAWFGVTSSKATLFCMQDGEDGMVNLIYICSNLED